MDATRRQLRSRISKGALVGLPWDGPPSLLLRRCRMLIRPMACLWEDVLHLHECAAPGNNIRCCESTAAGRGATAAAAVAAAAAE